MVIFGVVLAGIFALMAAYWYARWLGRGETITTQRGVIEKADIKLRTCPFCFHIQPTRADIISHVRECEKDPNKQEALRKVDEILAIEDKLIVKEREVEFNLGVAKQLKDKLTAIEEQKSGFPAGGYVVRAKHDENGIKIVLFIEATSKSDVKEKIKKTLHSSWKVCSIDSTDKKGEGNNANQTE